MQLGQLKLLTENNLKPCICYLGYTDFYTHHIDFYTRHIDFYTRHWNQFGTMYLLQSNQLFFDWDFHIQYSDQEENMKNVFLMDTYSGGWYIGDSNVTKKISNNNNRPLSFLVCVLQISLFFAKAKFLSSLLLNPKFGTN